jgi:hypothetical protein
MRKISRPFSNTRNPPSGVGSFSAELPADPLADLFSPPAVTPTASTGPFELVLGSDEEEDEAEDEAGEEIADDAGAFKACAAP